MKDTAELHRLCDPRESGVQLTSTDLHIGERMTRPYHRKRPENLDPLTVECIRHLRSQGHSFAAIARALKVSRQTVSRIDARYSTLWSM